MKDIKIEYSDNCLIFRAIGTITFSGILETTKKYGPQITRNLIWDCSATDSIEINVNQIRSYFNQITPCFVNREHGGKTALVGYDNCIFGIFNMFSTYAAINNFPYSVMAFRTLDEANNWLQAAHESLHYDDVKNVSRVLTAVQP